MVMPVPEHLFAMLAIAAAAGFVQGLAGFGAALVAVPLFALYLPLPTVVPLMVLITLGVLLLNLAHLRRSLQIKPLLPLLGGYALGTPLGLLVLTRLPESLVLGSLGLFLAAYGALSLSGRRLDYHWLREHRISIGMVSGALGSAFSTNGPPVILHVSAHPEWSADTQKALLTTFFLCSGLFTLAVLAGTGLVDGRVLELALWCLPALLAGSVLGIALYQRLGQHDYRRMVFGLITAMGVTMLLRLALAALSAERLGSSTVALPSLLYTLNIGP
jgi:uncharacterized membrane protein YfcA